jgi:effector-binding domain-containing protein
LKIRSEWTAKMVNNGCLDYTFSMVTIKGIRQIVGVTAFILIGAITAMATEEAPYKVITTDDVFELREYPPQILAETLVDGDLESAGSKAFNLLFRYISGDNHSQRKIPMTAPVSQEQQGEKISMTAPVSQQRVKEKWAVSFMMPSGYTLENLPVPDDPRVVLRQVPARKVASVRYSGFWSEEKFLLNKAKLEAWIRKNRLHIVGEPVWARYNPPFTPWFMRRNEILIPVTENGN